MKAKILEGLLARESGMHADMVARFQSLRNSSLLSRARGRNAEFLTPDEIVSSVLSMVSVRPGYAAVTAIGLRGLQPVGLPEDAFAKAPTLAEAFRRAIEDPRLRATVTEIRLGDSDLQRSMPTIASISYTDGGVGKVSHYVHKNALSLFHKGKEIDFDRMDMGFAVTRELVVSRRLLDAIAREIYRQESDAKQAEILATSLSHSIEA